MNYEDMSLSELKEYAKNVGIAIGNSGKAKLIEKIKEHDIMESVIEDGDLNEPINTKEYVEDIPTDTGSLIDSISNAIDEMDEAEENVTLSEEVSLSLDEMIPVKSITFGGLTYKARSTNAIYRWNNIGAIEYMSVAELNEMNNYKRSYLNKPLVVLLDERAIKKFRLQSVYENVAKINNLKHLFKQPPAVIERTIDNALDVNMRDILISKSRQMIKNGTLTDINVIKLLERKLQHDLSDTV